MNPARIVALALTTGLLSLALAACGGESSAAVADNPSAISSPGSTPAPAATSTPEPASPVVSTPASSLDDTVTSADPTLPPEPSPVVSEGMVKVPAPIESVDIVVAESFPPQYFVHIVSGLPNGCVEFYGYEETREGNSISITVTNLEPAPTNNTLACAAIYLTQETSVALGKDFESGETYTVMVNDVTETFEAQ